MKFSATLYLLLAALPAIAQSELYVGTLVGVATLSADGGSQITSASASSSSYKPENGGVLNLFGGIHLNNYISLQANFTANRNDLTLAAITTPNSVFEQMRNSSQVVGSGDVLLYFRQRRSKFRPYLSAGLGVSRISSELIGTTTVRGNAAPPPDKFFAVKPAFRTAVGIDIKVKNGWSFRYSFLEAIQRNPISVQLTPAGQRNLATFQNLFGFVFTSGRARP